MLQDNSDYEQVEINGDMKDKYHHVDNPQSKVAEHWMALSANLFNHNMIQVKTSQLSNQMWTL